MEDLDKREADDLEVSHFYVTTGNFSGAYLRAQDAVKTFPDDPEAHLALAQAAQKLKKIDEAREEYTLFLKLDPQNEKAGLARTALASLH